MYSFTTKTISGRVYLTAFAKDKQKFFDEYIAKRDCVVLSRDENSVTLHNNVGAMSSDYSVHATELKEIDGLHIPLEGDNKYYF